MSKGIASLIKISKNKLDQEGAILGSLKNQRAILENRKSQLQKKLKDEAVIAGDETLVYLAGFIFTIRESIQKVENEIKLLDVKISNQENVVRDLFLEKKKYDIVHQNNMNRIEDARKRNESLIQDETGMNQWLRREHH